MALLGVVSAVTGLLGGGSRKTGPATYRVDGARWSAAKQQWDLPPGTRAAVQSPRPTIVGLQDMNGGVVPGAPAGPPSGAVAGPPTTTAGVLDRIGQALVPTAQGPGGPTAPSPTSPDMLWLYAALGAGALVLAIAAMRR